MASKVSTIKLAGGVEIPILGLGTYKAQGDEIKATIKDALEIGYRHFDTADFYQNLAPIGEAIRDAIADGRVKREDVFITTKIWPTDYGVGRVAESARRQLTECGLQHFDLLLLHWPVVFADANHGDWFPRDGDDSNAKIKFGNRALEDIYAELETVQQSGLARAIGVSNFNAAQIEAILKTAKITPAMNQVEAHVYLSQKRLQQFCAERNIALTAYCPLAAGGNRKFNLLEDETLKTIAQNYAGKTAAQIAIRYLIQRGIAAIPKSVRRERLQSNFDVFDFTLSAEDMSILEALNRDDRIVNFDTYGTKQSANYPFDAEF